MSRPLVWVLLPVVLLVAIGAAFLLADPLRPFLLSALSGEELTVERAVLDGDGIALRVHAGDSEPIQIAQVQVDGAYWNFTQDPPGPLPYLASAWLRLPYPWVYGEVHHVAVLTSTGAAFEYPIDPR
jgi:zinc transporter, ZIP family